MLLYARNFLNHPKRFSRWYKKILLIVQKDFLKWYKKILLMVQKHFTDGTKSFYQAVNIKILKIIWKNKKEKSKTITVQIFLNTPSPLTLSKFLRKSLKKKSVRHKAKCLNQAPHRKNCHCS